MSTVPGDRMLAGLPAVFEASDVSGDLARLLGVFEALFFGDSHLAGGDASGSGASGSRLPGIERSLRAIPALFAPLGNDAYADPEADRRTPDHFLHWLATWLAFTPHALFSPTALRRIVAGIVPLYGLRGTRDYLLRLLALCFDEVREVHIDDRPRVGFTIGSSVLGSDTRLAEGRAFWFKVIVDLDHAAHARSAQDDGAALERRLRAVIDFAKPAHTAYELRVRSTAGAADAAAPA